MPDSSGAYLDHGRDRKRGRNPLPRYVQREERGVAATAFLEATVASGAFATGGATIFSSANGELTPIAILTIQGRDRGIASFSGFHGDEGEAAATACIAIRNDLGPGNGAMSREKGSQAIVRDGPRQIADVKFQKNLDRTPDGVRR